MNFRTSAFLVAKFAFAVRVLAGDQAKSRSDIEIVRGQAGNRNDRVPLVQAPKFSRFHSPLQHRQQQFLEGKRVLANHPLQSRIAFHHHPLEDAGVMWDGCR